MVFSAPIRARGSSRIWLALLLALAALVLAFAALSPYLDASGACGDPGCPEFSQGQSPASAFAEGLPAGVLAAALAVAAPAAGRVLRSPAPCGRPSDVYLPPEPEPPRL